MLEVNIDIRKILHDLIYSLVNQALMVSKVAKDAKIS